MTDTPTQLALLEDRRKTLDVAVGASHALDFLDKRADVEADALLRAKVELRQGANAGGSARVRAYVEKELTRLLPEALNAAKLQMLKDVEAGLK